MKGWMYILECADGSYYTGSTNDLESRLAQHQSGEGATHTKKRLPVKLVYSEEYDRIDKASYREKQIQKWTRKRKEALIAGNLKELHQLAECMNSTHFRYYHPSRCLSGAEGSETEGSEVISLTKKLISFNTVNPPGNERGIAEYIGKFLSENEFDVKYVPFDENRLHVVAEKGVTPGIPSVVFSGHFDVIPAGEKEWETHPFEGVVKQGKIYGRGASDMKGALASMVLASVSAFRTGNPRRGVRLILTAGEETGCQGISHLVKTMPQMGESALIIVGEPTSNIPCIGHKGALYMKVVTKGKTAHSSMPELGDNAIYKAARAIMTVADFRFPADQDPLLGLSTLNVGKMSGGLNLNSVPDHAEFTIDLRSTTRVSHSGFLIQLAELLGKEAEIEVLADLPAVATDNHDPSVKLVYAICGMEPLAGGFPKTLPYMTDGAVLQQFYKGAPTIILGPGQPEMAHQTDEFCSIEKLVDSVRIYQDILLKC